MRVLFVCSGNAFRSPVAEALLKSLRPDVAVESAGVSPAIPVSESARRYLARENAERYLKPSPEGLDEKPLRTYDLIVVMEPWHRDAVSSKCPECAERTVIWNIEDPYYMPPGSSEKTFNIIKRKVEELAASL